MVFKLRRKAGGSSSYGDGEIVPPLGSEGEKLRSREHFTFEAKCIDVYLFFIVSFHPRHFSRQTDTALADCSCPEVNTMSGRCRATFWRIG